MKKGHSTIVAYVEFCEKLGIKSCDAKSVACYSNFIKEARKAAEVTYA